MIPLSQAAFWLASSHLALAQVNNFFVNPPNAGQPLFFVENDVFSIGDEIDVQWVTTQTEFSVWLWQQSFTTGAAVLGDTVFTKILGGPDQDSFNWTVTQQSFDLDQSDVFFFALNPPSQPQITSGTVTSHYFNLTQSDQATPTGLDTQNTTSTSATATVPPASATSAAESHASNPPSSNITLPNSGQDKSTRNGQLAFSTWIGVSVGVGLPLLAAVLYLVIRHARKRSTSITQKRTDPKTITPARVVDPFKVFSPQEVSGGDMFRLSKIRRGNELPAYHDSLAELPVEKPARI